MKVMLAKPYTGQSVDGWLMSEKLDGVRAVWDGCMLWTRNEKRIYAPEWFTKQLPKGKWLDGELWAGRGRFQYAVSTVRKKAPIDEKWADITYQVFDLPMDPSGYRVRVERYTELLQGNSVAKPVEHEECRHKAHLEEYFSLLVAAGAEGVMLRARMSPYEPKRSGYLLKMKPTDSDEGVVIGYKPGEGKHLGRVGAVIVKWRTKEVDLGTGLTDAQRENPPKIGALVTFEYRGLTDDGQPRHPSFIGVRDYE